MSRLGRKIWKWSAALLAALLILLAIGVGLFRVAVPMVPGLRADAEIVAQQAIGWPVHIGEIDLQWALLGPELVLTDVQLLAPDTFRPLVTAARLDIVFGPLDFFQQGTPRPSHIRLHEPTLALERDASGELFLSGFALPATTATRLDWREFLDFALRHGRVTIIDGELHYRDATLDVDDWLLRLPEFSVASDGNEHEFKGSFLPPGALGEEIAVAFTATGRPATPEDWLWKLNMAVRAMKVDWWYQQFQWADDAQLHGSLDLGLLVSGKGLQGMTGAGQLAMKDLGFTPRAPIMSSAADRFDRIALDWEFDYGDGRLALDVSELEVVTARDEFTDGSFAMLIGGETWPVEIAAARLPLSVLAQFAQFIPTRWSNEQDARSLSDLRRRIVRLSPRGDLRELVLGLNLDAEPARFRVETRFERLGIAPYESLPGFSGLSGTLRSDENNGRLQLASEDVVVDTDGLFRTPLPVQKLQGNFAWQRQDAGWQVRGTEIIAENPEVSATAELVLDLPAQGSPYIDLTATALDADFDARSTWLPTAAMPEKLVEWLDTAIVDGRAPEAKLVLRGPLQNYPFRDGSGVFDVKFRAEDTIVKFAPDWPRVEGLSAAVHFHNAALDIFVDEATVEPGLNIEQARVGYADSRDGVLDVDADVDADIATAWQFLAASPLAERLSGMLGAIDVSGPMRANVQLSIPTDNVSATSLDVAATLNEIHVQPTAVPWPVESLSGEVNVTESTVFAETLAGRFTGAPFHVSISSEPVAENGFAPVRIDMRGHSPVTAFETYLPDTWLQALAGEFDWNGLLRIPGDGSGVAMNFSSALAGVTSNLPAPLAEMPPMDVDIVIPAQASGIDVQLQAQELGAAHLRFVELPSGWSFDRGRVVMGAQPEVALGNESGLFIAGEVQTLAAGDWLSLDNDDATGTGNAFLRGVDITAAQLELGAITLPAQRVSAVRAGAGWDVALTGSARGVIHVPSLLEARAPWQVWLEQLHLPVPEAAPDTPARTAPDPRTLPTLDLDIRDLKVGTVELGHLRGVLQRTSIGYTAQNLVAETGSYRLAMDGRWELVDEQHYTSITAVLDSSDVGDTLEQLGYRGGLEADEGHIETNLAWHAAPMHLDRGLLEGNAQMLFKDGSLSEVSPGAGRLLGLLSIAALPRRLTLDFSDFFGEGLHFDTLGGEFLITGGSAYTTNVVLEGPSISALLVGRTGLVARDYDQLVIVDPDVSASIPVAGYLAAGPTVGAALLLLSQLLKAPLADITQVKYRITGSWDDPVIERVRQEQNGSE